MAYQICKRCNKMFEKNERVYCNSCFEKIEIEYELILKHIHKYPNATVLDIITETGVSLKTINCLVEDGGVSYVENKLSIKDKDENSNVADRTLLTRTKFHLTR